MKLDLRMGDCLELMQSIPDDSVDLILCDLPYGTTACKWDSVIPFDALWTQYKRIAKPNAAVILNAAQPFASIAVASNLEWFRYDWYWHKIQATGHMNAKLQPLRACESILVFYQKQPTYNPIMRQGKAGKRTRTAAPLIKQGNVYRDTLLDLSKDSTTERYPTTFLEIGAGRSPTTKTVHPTQKPVPLMEYLIRTYTNEGDTVLDSCMGSGTTGVACMNLARKFIGIEKDEQYFQIASDRIRAAVPQAANDAEAQLSLLSIP